MKQLLIFVFFALFFQSVQADCVYQEKSYPVFEKVVVMDPQYVDEIKEQGISGDGYALVLHCLPVIDTEAVSQGKFSITSIPAVADAWVPSEIMIAFDKPDVIYPAVGDSQ